MSPDERRSILNQLEEGRAAVGAELESVSEQSLRPEARFSSVEGALRAFLEARESTVRYLETVDDDLRARKTIHPVAGEITCRECLALLIGHPLRHIDQIREVRSAPGFPV